jgi:anthranilate phosphoribosyltransferase
VDRALVVFGSDGLDEISPSAETKTWEVQGGAVREGTVSPDQFGLARAPRAEIVGGEPAKNADIARRVLNGADGGARTAVLMNAAAACYVAGLAESLQDGAAVAAKAIDSGAAANTLTKFAAESQRLGAVEAKT